MKKWNSFILSLAGALLAFAPIMPLNGCGFWFLGESQLPKKLLMQKEGKLD
jgi:hypothetical protein